MLKRPDGPEIAARMTTAAQLASRLPASYVKFSLNGKGLDWFVRQGWRDGWAKLLAIETTAPEASAAPGPQPVSPHRECENCDEGWIYVDVDTVADCPVCRPRAVPSTPRKQPSRAGELTAAADLIRVLEFQP